MIPKICIEVGNYGLLAFKTPLHKSPLVRLADAFEVKNKQQLAILRHLRTNPTTARAEEELKLLQIINTGKEITYHDGGNVNSATPLDFVHSGPLGQLGPAGIEYASFHLNFDNWPGETNVWGILANHLQLLKTGFGGVLGFENVAYQSGFPGYGTEHTTNPEFISEFFRRFPSVNFLLDPSHAQVSATALRTDIGYYLKNLPIKRVRHIHLSHPAWKPSAETGRLQLIDAHEVPQAEEFAFLELALTMGAKPEYLTIEFFRDEDRLVRIHEELLRFFQRPILPPFVRDFTLLDHGFRSAQTRIADLPAYDRGEITRICQEHLTGRQEEILEEMAARVRGREISPDTPKNVATHTTNIFVAFFQAQKASYEEMVKAEDPISWKGCACAGKRKE